MKQSKPEERKCPCGAPMTVAGMCQSYYDEYQRASNWCSKCDAPRQMSCM